MGLADALIGGIVLPTVTILAATLLKRAGKPQRSAEDWALAFELLVAAVVLAAALAFQSVSELADATVETTTTILSTRVYVAIGLVLLLLFVSLGTADWLRGKFELYDVERLPPGPPTRETVARIGGQDIRATNIMAVTMLVAVYPIVSLLPKLVT